ncbi:MAG: AsmA family protein, partial [Gemmatimonadota bacterium]
MDARRRRRCLRRARGLLLPPARLAAWVTPRVETALGAHVEVEGVRLRVFPVIAIRVERLTVANPEGFSDRPLFRLDALDLRPRLWPLISRDILVNEVRLQRPRLLIESSASGEWNLSALAAARPAPDSAPATAAAAERGGPAAFAVNRLVVSDGVVLYDDQATGRAVRVGDLGAELALSGDLSGGERFEATARIALGDLQARSAGSDTVTALPPLALDVDAGVRLNPDSAHLRDVRLRWGGVAVAGSG